MDISYSKEHEEYREKVRHWLLDNIPESNNGRYTYQQRLDWEKVLFNGGYSATTWPPEYNGQGKDQVFQVIFNEESARLNSPRGANFVGKVIVGPTLLEFGTESQKNRYLSKIASGEENWCQCFSEPNAGSDLASLRTKAEYKNGKWIINGQKIWASNAKFADYGILLARTDSDAPKHKGITLFILPMNTEGITINSLKQMSGEEDSFSEVFFDDVVLEGDCVVGGVNNGWNVAMRAFSYERGGDTIEKAAAFHQELLDLIEISGELESKNDRTIKSSSYFRQNIAKMYTEVMVLKYLGLKSVNKLINNEKITTESSVNKLYWSEYHKRFGELAMEVLGCESPYWGEEDVKWGAFHHIFIKSRSETIYAGTSQIQKNIIAERILGMER
ncbi:acyl-CoA dehydrogenase family protein [Oceanobacillus saliphilus]|uniref:acyl-CoA dehydrogenase family protein n=1 Tax=Oceanobacillus saliphilus TaxID=2925834 RepID=UPI00201D4B0C|nr:acyl-CoA dehydrogenase family protein [Oceanobacillus saliphilus]